MQMILRPSLRAAFMGDRSNVIEMRVAKPVWQLSGGSLTQKPTCDIGVWGAKKEPHFKNATKGQNLIFVKYGYLRVRSVLPYTQVCFSHQKESMLLVHMPVGGRVRGRWEHPLIRWWFWARLILTALLHPSLNPFPCCPQAWQCLSILCSWAPASTSLFPDF